MFFAHKHGCSFEIKVLQQKLIPSPLLQGGQELYIRQHENHYSVNKNEVDDSKEILEDLKELREGLKGLGSDDELEVEDTDIVMVDDE